MQELGAAYSIGFQNPVIDAYTCSHTHTLTHTHSHTYMEPADVSFISLVKLAADPPGLAVYVPSLESF